MKNSSKVLIAFIGIISILSTIFFFSLPKTPQYNNPLTNIATTETAKIIESKSNLTFASVDTIKVTSLATALQRHSNRLSFFSERGSGKNYNQDSLILEREAIIQTLKNYENEVFDLKNETNTFGIHHSCSKDKALCIFNWCTEEGGASTYFDDVVVIKSNDKPIILAEKDIPNKSYNRKIADFITQENGEMLYKIMTNSRGEELFYYEDLTIYKIENDTLKPQKLFPNNAEKVSMRWSQKHEDVSKMLHIEVSENGKHIKLPVTNKEGIFQKTFQELRFNGVRFVEF
jgi:hypothetical protein